MSALGAVLGFALPLLPVGDGARPDAPAFSGRVLDESTRAPIEGAEILVFFGSADDRGGGRAGRTTADARATSGADGSFAIDFDRSVRWFDCVVRAPRKSLREYDRWGRGSRLDVLLWDSLVVTGRVTAADGAPVGGARVEIESPHDEFDGPKSATADADGRYRVDDVPIDPRGMRVTSADGLRVTAVPFRGPSPPAATRDVVIDEGARVFVHVVDAERRPIAGATVYAWTPESPLGDALRMNGAPVGMIGSTNADGEFALPHVAPQELRLAAIAGGHAAAETRVDQTRTHGAIDVELMLPREASATCIVNDARGKPATDARVEAWWFTPDEGMQPFADVRALDVVPTAAPENAFAFAATPDAEGRVRLTGLPPLPRGRLFATTADGRRADLALPDLEPGDAVDAGAVALDRIVRFTGRLLGPDGTPPADGRAEFRRVDADGRFAVDASDARPFVLDFSADGLLPARRAFAHDVADVVDVGDVVLARGRTFEGRVVDARGEPIAGALVSVTGAEPDPVDGSFEVTQSARAGDDGKFAVRGLPAALKSMSVQAAGFANANRFDLPDSTAMDVVLSPAGITAASITTAIRCGIIAGRVIDAKSGAPVAGFALRIRAVDPPEAVPWLPAADELFVRDENFRMNAVPVGRWHVLAVAPGYAPAFSAEVDVKEGATAGGVVVALERGETLAIDAGAAARDASVALTPVENAPGPMLPASATLGADGTASIEHLAPGRYRIEGGSRTIAFAAAEPVEVVAGGDQRVELTPVAGGVVRLYRFRDCTPEPTWRYSIVGADGVERRAGWIAHGAEVVHFLPAGRYRLTTDDPNGAPREFEVAPGRTADVAL